MASCDIQKLHGSEAFRVLGHDARWSGREDVEYKNRHINPELTYKNAVVLSDETYRGETHAQTYKRLQERVKAIDIQEPPKRVRADRVTMVAFEVPCPPGLTEEQENKFFCIAADVFTEACGGPANVSNMYIHRDEEHLYLDSATKTMRTSLTNGHMVGIPYVEGVGVNCKQWATKEMFRGLNRAIHDRCQRELGIDFMDGTGAKSQATIEQLKLASARAAAELSEQKRAELAETSKELDKTSKELDRTSKELTAARDAKKSVEPYLKAKNHEPERRSFLGHTIVPSREYRQLTKQAEFVEESADALKVYQDVERLRAEAEQSRQEAEREARRTVNDAKRRAADIRDKAEREAERLKIDAEREADEIVQSAYDERDSVAGLVENAKVRQKLDAYEKLEGAFPNVFKQMRDQLREDREIDRTDW